MFFMRILLLMNFLFIDCDLNLYSLSFVVFVFNVICLLVFINYVMLCFVFVRGENEKLEIYYY